MIFLSMEIKKCGKDCKIYVYKVEMEILGERFGRTIESYTPVDTWTLLCGAYQWKAEVEMLWTNTIRKRNELKKKKESRTK